ncbi:GTP-binding protein [Sporobacter termitidis DSM 10068]|uniref:Probable GTP-binding protein EngB n=1 Tax=Sporobacter termitidis DSM 10068 TaxID=1123282 RepID=A0A1M5TJX3_9FIRM|nr:ribosome biogenesis GTP-binding protein YihA/YsxC [Sporobacter termitidis]SHH51067.1 GTP-binding protein [Sporobacter termitidis DSM 10068]
MNVQNAKFIKSAAAPKDFISNGLPQVAFAGKSNVGKSSVINRLVNRRNFARVGATPGKTAHVNYFLIDERAYFVDLPGYGYAKVSLTEKQRWAKLMETYFQDSGRIDCGVLIVDARHDPTADDKLMAGWFKGTGRPLLIVANKVDKLNATGLKGCGEKIREGLELGAETPVILFSAEKGTGREALLKEIENIANC